MRRVNCNPVQILKFLAESLVSSRIVVKALAFITVFVVTTVAVGLSSVTVIVVTADALLVVTV